jgi:hypothetical protein
VCWVRRHLFWDCFVARTLREELVAALAGPGAAPGSVIDRPHLWLVLPPPGLHPCVWDVVALAALAAIEKGRQHMYRGGASPAPLRRAQLVGIGAEVVADFWARVASFAALGLVPDGWSLVSSAHPFLANRSGRVVFVLVWSLAFGALCGCWCGCNSTV